MTSWRAVRFITSATQYESVSSFPRSLKYCCLIHSQESIPTAPFGQDFISRIDQRILFSDRIIWRFRLLFLWLCRDNIFTSLLHSVFYWVFLLVFCCRSIPLCFRYPCELGGCLPSLSRSRAVWREILRTEETEGKLTVSAPPPPQCRYSHEQLLR